MINISKIFELNIGDKVVVTGNTCGHSYQIGQEFTITNVDIINKRYLLDSGVYGNYWVNLCDLDHKNIGKQELINNLSDMLEFLNDYEGDIQESSKLDKEYKVYRILKELKSIKSDFEKIGIISKYI